MSPLTAGLATVGATLSYGTATVLQASAVQRSGDGPLLRRVLGQSRYLLGLALDLAGFALGVLALRTLPLFLVQAALAASIGVTALLSVRWLGSTLHRAEGVGLAVLALGLLLLAAAAGPGRSTGLPTEVLWIGGPALLLTALTVPSRPRLAGVVAGLAGAVAGIAARSLVVPHPLWRLALSPVALLLAVAGAVCAWSFAVALEASSPATATAACFGVSTVVPAVVGLTLLGDGLRAGFGPAVVLGVLLVVGATVALARFAAAEPAAAGFPPAAATA